MASEIAVSVVVPVRNGAHTIGNMLSALVNQAGAPENRELIVVDNGSTDATRDVVGKYPVTLLEEHRRGPAAARNCGLHRARGEVIAHLDADTVPTRRWLAEILAPFADPATVLVAGKTLSFPPRTPPERYLARFQLYDAEKNIDRAVLPFVASMNMAVRRAAALAIGGWDEEMMTSEDVDFSTRLLARFPGKIGYAPGAVLFHRNRDSVEGLRRQAFTYGEGVADTYRRYPSVVPWGLPQYARLVRNLLVRSTKPAIFRVGQKLGLVDSERVEYAYYHRMWTWWFWRGFFRFRRVGRRHEP